MNVEENKTEKMTYGFLFRPLFFIFSIIFATWLVFFIEQLYPSDFGRFGKLFESKSQPAAPVNVEIQNDRKCLKQICYDYKAGLIDSVEMNIRLEEFLKGRHTRVSGN